MVPTEHQIVAKLAAANRLWGPAVADAVVKIVQRFVERFVLSRSAGTTHWLALARDGSHSLRDAALGLDLATAGVHFEMWFALKGLHRNER